MAETRTEALHRNAEGLDIQAPEAILVSLVDAQIEAAKAVRNAIPSIARAAEIIADRLNSGGKLAYAAAGSSGLMALADALELPGTFGIQRAALHPDCRRRVYRTLAGGPEDDTEEAATAVANAGIGAGDCLIALSASGTTPYAVRAIEEAAGARCGHHRHRQLPVPRCSRVADVAILLQTPPEVSFRLDAHGRRHGAEDRFQHVFDACRRASRPRSRRRAMVNAVRHTNGGPQTRASSPPSAGAARTKRPRLLAPRPTSAICAKLARRRQRRCH